MWAILSCWFFTFTFMYKSKSNLRVSSYSSVNGTNFIQKSETGGKWTEEIRSLQNCRKPWRCVLGPGSWSWSLENQSSGTRAVSDSQEDPRVMLAAAHFHRLWKPCLAAFSLPSRACCRCLLSQSGKCAFQTSCPGLKGSRHVSEMLTSSSHNCCWSRILIGRWESGGNFACCSFLAWSPARLENRTGDLWTEVMSCWLVNPLCSEQIRS